MTLDMKVGITPRICVTRLADLIALHYPTQAIQARLTALSVTELVCPTKAIQARLTALSVTELGYPTKAIQSRLSDLIALHYPTNQGNPSKAIRFERT